MSKKYTIQKLVRPGGYVLMQGDILLAQFFESPKEAYRLASLLRRLLLASVAGAEEAPASLDEDWCTCKGYFECEGHRA